MNIINELHSQSSKLRKIVAREAPLAYRAFFGRKYLLPNYRAGDYTAQDFQNWVMFDRVCTFAAGAAPRNDEIWMITLSCNVAALNYERPTLFLERELGEALIRTDILKDFVTGDIHWRWPAFRVYLPSGLISFERPDGLRWPVYFDIARIDEQGISCPRAIAQEVDRFVANYVPERGRFVGNLARVDFKYQEAGVIIGTALNKSDNPDMVQTIYAQLKPWGKITATSYQDIAGDLKGGAEQDEIDKLFLRRLEHLTLNVMLLLSASPVLYEPDAVLRAASSNPRKPAGELVRARFVGDLYLRAAPVKRVVSVPTGRHLPAHWVSGHWRRVVVGPGRTGRKLVWIQPYSTRGEEEEEEQ